MTTSLDLQHFEELLDVHGADVARWPDPWREPALQLLEASDAARRARARAEGLSRLLDAVPAAEPSAQLRARIAAIPARHPRQHWVARWWPFGNPLAPLLAWSAAALLGLLVGNGTLGTGILAASEQVEPQSSTGSASGAIPVASSSDGSGSDDLADVSGLLLGNTLLGNTLLGNAAGWEDE
jgi:hypothetical protein